MGFHLLFTRVIFKGIAFFLIGIIMLLGSFKILSWNEHRAVEQYKRLNEISHAAQEISVAEVPSMSDGSLVYVSGSARTSDILEDPVFGVSVTDSIHLRRVVHMLQWEEVKKTEGRSSSYSSSSSSRMHTTYSYRLVWSPQKINSNNFNTRDRSKRNPDSMLFEGVTVSASNIELGALQVDPTVTSQIEQYEPLPLPLETLVLPPNGYVDDGYIFIREDRRYQQAGDLRISFETVPADELSIISGLQGNLLNLSWEDSSGQPYSRAYRGTLSKQSMIVDARSELQADIWIGRVVSAILMLFGLFVMTAVRQFLSTIPFIQRIANLGIFAVCGVTSAIFSLLIIARAWANVRPMMSVFLVAVALGLLLLFYKYKQKKSAEKTNEQGQTEAF